jgi:NAD-dependent deacetylase
VTGSLTGSPTGDGPVTPDPCPVPPQVLAWARSARRVTVLTGAGMSAESGVPTFRGTRTGLWARFDPTRLATPQAWRADPDLVWAWYLWRIALVRVVAPNAGHHALACWSQLPGVDLQIATQNVDDLHERAGSSVLAHVHGSLEAFRCDTCDRPYDEPVVPTDPPRERAAPPYCGQCPGRIRPGVVWFGEGLPGAPFEAAVGACQAADLVLVVGTSGLVHPAAGLPALARARGIPVVEVNPQESALTDQVDHSWRATAARALPGLVAALASGAAGRGPSGPVPSP